MALLDGQLANIQQSALNDQRLTRFATYNVLALPLNVTSIENV